MGGPSSCHENIFLQPTPISPPLLVAVVWTGRRICQQCFLMAATRDIKLLGSVRGEAMQRQKNDCIWQQSRLFFKCSEWIPSSATSGCGCISECVKNSFLCIAM